MSFNFSELQQKADRILHNSDEFVRKWVDFLASPAGTVSLQYYDQNGNLQTVSFSNRNKLVQDFIANANSVMAKTFYVDAVNGNDNNDGSSANPFKTIQKAADSVPVAGYAHIIIVSDYTGTFAAHFRKLQIEVALGKTWTIPYANVCSIAGSQITVLNRGSIIIEGGVNTTPDNYAGFFVSNYETNSDLSVPTSIYFVNLSTTNPIRVDSGRFLFGSRYAGINQNIQLNLGIYNIYCSGSFILDGGLMKLNNGCGSFQWNNYGNDATFAVVNSANSPVDIKTTIGGIVKDTNGVPRNISSNIVL